MCQKSIITIMSVLCHATRLMMTCMWAFEDAEQGLLSPEPGIKKSSHLLDWHQELVQEPWSPVPPKQTEDRDKDHDESEEQDR